MRGWIIALGVAGCGFQHGAAAVATGSGVDAPSPPDSPADSMGSVGSDAAVPPPCQTSDTSLVWCLEFDEAGLASATTAIDSSGLRHDPAISGISLATRSVPASSQAITTAAGASISLAKPTDFDVQLFTISAWIDRTSSAELGILDTGMQYTLSISSVDHTVECAVSNGSTVISYTGGSPTAIDEWDLVACTYDGSQVCTYSFRNGSNSGQKACANRNSGITTVGTTTTVGEWANAASPFIGSLDQIRLYSRALSQQEICTAGGLSGC